MDLTELAPLEGGWSAQTFLAEADGRRVVVRRYDDEYVPLVDAALLRRAAALVPVPEVLDVRAGRLVTSYVEGVRGDLLLPELDGAGLARLGAELGSIAATLAGTPTRTAGLFVDAELTIEPFDLTSARLGRAAHGGLAHWSADELAGLHEIAEEAELRLASVGRTSFVHSDLNPKNLIVDPDSLTVAAVLDWEFAHSGSPYTDLGNAVRFDRQRPWVEAVVDDVRRPPRRGLVGRPRPGEAGRPVGAGRAGVAARSQPGR